MLCKVMITIAVCLWVLGLCVTPQTSLADDSVKNWISKIVSIQGSAMAKSQGQSNWRPLRLNDSLVVGDEISVGANSRVCIVLCNDAVMRLDQNTTLIFDEIEPQSRFILKMLKGVANFFSHQPCSLKIVTPFVNGVVEGTEFLVQVDDEKTLLDLFEGHIQAENHFGSLQLHKGQGAVASAGQAPQSRILVKPRDSVQWALYYPPILTTDQYMGMGPLREADAMFNQGQPLKALAILSSIPASKQDVRFFNYRAGLLLHVGRVKEALADISHALEMDARNGAAMGLKAIIAVVQNQKENALILARKAVQTAPQSAAAQLALSYACQARFDLDGAMQAAQDAVKNAPEDGIAWSRLAELNLSTGNLNKGVQAAQKAVQINPRLAHAHAMLGFAYLTQIKADQARTAFQQAIVLDSAAPLPRLGLGLADIRSGHLTEGRGQIEIAAGLDPGNALIRSYLGKAYFDEKRSPLDARQLEIAKTLDPKDPTPWFYDAIGKQTLNRPVEGLQDLQTSIALNDNRAVYRSRLLLDEDLAARSAGLGRIYNDLGFSELALLQGWQSLYADPTNYSAHRLLADGYGGRPRHEIARVSEMLQAQLLQPVSIAPVQPQLTESGLLLPERLGTTAASLNEYNPLFAKNGVTAQVNGLVGSDDTLGDAVTLSGIYDKISCSAGQYHYETNGFRENSDLEENTYNTMIQAAVTPRFNVQAEFRHNTFESGWLNSDWNLETVRNPYYRTEENRDTWRVGLHIKNGTASDILASLIYQNWNQDQYDYSEPVAKYDADGFSGEVQYLHRQHYVDFILGLGRYNLNAKTMWDYRVYYPDEPNFFGVDNSDTQFSNCYFYTYIRYPDSLVWTVGASYDDFEHDLLGQKSQLNPKLGLKWALGDATTLRLAAFKVLKRELLVDQTIEPTHVAGFSQFFDDYNGTESTLYGAAIDQRLHDHLLGGVSYYQRMTLRPYSDDTEDDIDEKSFQGYLYWMLSPHMVLSANYAYEKIHNNNNSPAIKEMTLHRVPITLGYFHPSGVFGQVKATYLNENIVDNAMSYQSQQDNYVLVDLTAGYRLPRRLGVISCDINNLFSQEFNYMGYEYFESNPKGLNSYKPDRTFFLRFTFLF